MQIQNTVSFFFVKENTVSYAIEINYLGEEEEEEKEEEEREEKDEAQFIRAIIFLALSKLPTRILVGTSRSCFQRKAKLQPFCLFSIFQ